MLQNPYRMSCIYTAVATANTSYIVPTANTSYIVPTYFLKSTHTVRCSTMKQFFGFFPGNQYKGSRGERIARTISLIAGK